MNLNEYIKKLKQAKELKIEYREHNNEFFSSVKGIINTMDNKKKKISKIDLVLLEMREGFRQVNARLDKVEARLDRLESDVAQIKQCPTIKRELDQLNNN